MHTQGTWDAWRPVLFACVTISKYLCGMDLCTLVKTIPAS